jgi:hypothetical protein
MLAVAYLLQIALMMGLPVGLCLVLCHRWGTGWRLVASGALTFVASQLVHLPLVYWLTAPLRLPGVPKPSESTALAVNAVMLGLLAGLCEQLANYIALKKWLPRARGVPCGHRLRYRSWRRRVGDSWVGRSRPSGRKACPRLGVMSALVEKAR